MKNDTSCLFIVFAHIRSQAQTSDKLHELVTKFAQSKPDTSRIRLSLDLAEYYYNYTMRVPIRMNSVAFCLKKGEALNRKVGNATLQIWVNLSIAMRHFELNHARNPVSFYHGL